MELVKRLLKKLKNLQNTSNEKSQNDRVYEEKSITSFPQLPVRTCVICRNKFNKSELDRLVFINNEIIIDVNHRVNSYGYYICENQICQISLNKWIKKKKIKRIEIESGKF